MLWEKQNMIIKQNFPIIQKLCLMSAATENFKNHFVTAFFC